MGLKDGKSGNTFPRFRGDGIPGNRIKKERHRARGGFTMVNESRFTPRARNVLRLGHQAAGELGHSYVGTEHLLLGLMGETSGVACRVLLEHGADREQMRRMAAGYVGEGAPGTVPTQGLTPRARRSVEYAASEAVRSGSGCIGTEHLLLGILREGDNMAIRLLRGCGIDPRRLQSALLQRINPPARSAPEPPRGDARTRTLNEYATDLTAAACEKFNAETPDSGEVFYQSVMSYCKKARSGKFPLNLSYHLVKHFDGRNDGLVSVDSAEWGEKFTLIEPAGSRGISHGDVIDLNRENIPGFDVREFYVGLVSDLKKRGF